MSISFRCPQCQASLRVPAHMAGQRVQCPGCNNAVNASDTPASFAAAPFAPFPTSSPPTFAPPPQPSYYEPPPPPLYPPPPMPYLYHYPPASDDSSAAALGITSMVLGLVGFVVVFLPCIGWILGGILAVLGIVFSGISLASATKESGNGCAIAGMILCILAIVWAPIYHFVFMSIFWPHRF